MIKLGYAALGPQAAAQMRTLHARHVAGVTFGLVEPALLDSHVSDEPVIHSVEAERLALNDPGHLQP
jgi:hypothetical protein